MFCLLQWGSESPSLDSDREQTFWHLVLVWFSFGKRVQYYLSPAVIQISHLISKFFEKGKLHGTAQNLHRAASVLDK